MDRATVFGHDARKAFGGLLETLGTNGSEILCMQYVYESVHPVNS